MKGDRLGEFEEFTLLAVCALRAPIYGVPVQRFVEDATARRVSMGAVYAALGRLEDKGFVRSSMGEPTAERGGKPKRLFQVTPLGLRTAKELRRVREKNLERDRRGPVVSTDPRPPRLARWLLRLQPLGDRRPEIEADLLELFQSRAAERGRRHAARRYYADIASLWRRPRAAVHATAGRRTAGRRLARFFADLRIDLLYATRLIRRQPAFAAVAIVSLAFGVGANTLVFSVINALVLKPLARRTAGGARRSFNRRPAGPFPFRRIATFAIATTPSPASSRTASRR